MNRRERTEAELVRLDAICAFDAECDAYYAQQRAKKRDRPDEGEAVKYAARVYADAPPGLDIDRAIDDDFRRMHE